MMADKEINFLIILISLVTPTIITIKKKEQLIFLAKNLLIFAKILFIIEHNIL